MLLKLYHIGECFISSSDAPMVLGEEFATIRIIPRER
jgi:hypothetical protein